MSGTALCHMEMKGK